MDSVNVKREDLLAKVQENRAGHRAIYEEALEGYKDKVLLLLDQAMQEVAGGMVKAFSFSLPFPQDHTKDYDRVIVMLEMSQDELIELEHAEASQWVLDDWGWKQQFLASTAQYSATANTMLLNS